MARGFYDRDPVEVARDLLGRLLVRQTDEGITAGRIVEVEAYLAHNDPANHAFRGRTRRNATMFGPPGHAYVYPIHARWCLNAVTEPEGIASAVLIRAVEPLEGVGLMQQRRKSEVLRDLARGPARLCEAFAIDRTLDGWDLTRGEQLWIAEAAAGPYQGLKPASAPAAAEIVTAPRIGVTSAHDLLLRFFLKGNPFVSRPGRR